MRRWRKGDKEDDSEILTFYDIDDDDDDDDDDEEDVKPRRRLAPSGSLMSDLYKSGIGVGNSRTFDELEPMIRAGKYKPKQEDPYTAHILYQALIDLGDIEGLQKD